MRKMRSKLIHIIADGTGKEGATSAAYNYFDIYFFNETKKKRVRKNYHVFSRVFLYLVLFCYVFRPL